MKHTKRLIYVVSILLMLRESCSYPPKCIYEESLFDLRCRDLEAIPNLRNIPSDLRILDFSHGEIDVIETNSFRYKKLLTVNVVSMKENHLFFIEPGAFDTFANLQELDLSKNLLRVIPRIIIEKNRQLLWLNLSNNLFSGPAPLISSSSLQILDLSHSKIASLFPENLANLPNLTSLKLAGNNLKTLTYDVFEQRVNLHVSLAFNNWECSCNTIQLFQQLLANNQTMGEEIICMKSNRKYEKIMNASAIIINLCKEVPQIKSLSFVQKIEMPRQIQKEKENSQCSFTIVICAIFLIIVVMVGFIIIVKSRVFSFDQYNGRGSYDRVTKM